MSGDNPSGVHVGRSPGTEKPRRFRPKLRYELIDCGLHGHEILGMEAAELRARGRDLRPRVGRPALVPVHAVRLVAAARARRIIPPGGTRPRGTRSACRCGAGTARPLRAAGDRRGPHGPFPGAGRLAAAVLLFAVDRAALNAEFTRILDELQGGVGGPNGTRRPRHHPRAAQPVYGPLQNLFLVGAASPRTPCWRESRRSGCGTPSGGPST